MGREYKWDRDLLNQTSVKWLAETKLTTDLYMVTQACLIIAERLEALVEAVDEISENLELLRRSTVKR